MAGGQGTFRVMLRMEIRPGMEPGFEATWHEVGQAVTGHSASLGQWLCRSLDEEGVYWVISDWSDERGFREFEHSDAHVSHRRRLHPYRSSGTMTTMSVVYEMPSSAMAGDAA